MDHNLKMGINKKIKFVGSFLIIGILIMILCSLVSAFGVSSGYSEDRPLTVYPSEVRSTSIRLKTGSSEGTLTIEAELLDDGGIATLTDSNLEYSVSPGFEGDGVVNIRLTIPSSASVGGKYLAKFKFTDITPSEGEGGTVGLTTGSLFSLHIN